MFTILLATLEAFATNRDFDPFVMYVGTFFIDLSIIEGIIKYVT